MRISRYTRPALAVMAIGSLALVGCGGGDDSADDTTTTTEAETTTTEAETTTTAAPETTAVTETTAAPAAEVLVFPADHTARITVDKTDVTSGDVVTAQVAGFAPGSSLASSFIATWPPSDIPDPDHMATYLPDVAVADANGAATVEITIDPVCAEGDCYMVVADGIGPNGIYAGVKLNYQG